MKKLIINILLSTILAVSLQGFAVAEGELTGGGLEIDNEFQIPSRVDSDNFQLESQTNSQLLQNAASQNEVAKNASFNTTKEPTFNVRDQLNPRFLDTEKDNADHWEDNGSSPIINFFMSIIDFALRIMGPIAVLMIIIAGVFMITSLGKTQKIDEAKDQIFYVFLGLLFAFLSYIIVIFFQGIFSINS